MNLHKRPTLACLLLGFSLGCGGEVRFSDSPPGGGDHLRPGLTVNVRAASEAESIAQALGWARGVPGAEVRVHRIGTDFAWETAVTDDHGTAYLPQLVSGRYRVAVYRPLTDAESGQTGQAGVAALASGRTVSVGGAGTEQTMELVPNQTESLVISEVYAPATSVAEFSYNFHMFFELYNNSDRTVFLDGLTFGRSQLIDIAAPVASCAESARFRKDPDGIWTVFLHRFPGSGDQYPLGPGRGSRGRAGCDRSFGGGSAPSGSLECRLRIAGI
ncbi:carboxypeptidase-like regulatory domain-containing protein [Candidatus Palauibacter sp.]|uniref:carboxypeptidase-like regulatory domain-containing protein n=1 Tax=Candidatus Palauibacter sp. TaxID=3101350 RepID=UPI003B026A67